MHINLEVSEANSIQAYSDRSIKINSISYEESLIVSREEIISDLTIKKIQDIDMPFLELIMGLNPEVIIIGHTQTGCFPPIEIIQYLTNKGIGIECMSIGAACRTYNVLLSEGRSVVVGFIKECSI
ncbi:MAG: Mth938-like domain-containing protein [Legionella sp.]|nr:Mth938-like domain-containing protein [Legionella sp.]